MKKRDRLEIIQDFLEAIRTKGGAALPTHVMYKANLSSQMLTEYTNELMKRGLIENTFDKKQKKRITLTKKGKKFLRDFSVIRGFMHSYGLE